MEEGDTTMEDGRDGEENEAFSSTQEEKWGKKRQIRQKNFKGWKEKSCCLLFSNSTEKKKKKNERKYEKKKERIGNFIAKTFFLLFSSPIGMDEQIES